VCYTDKLVHEEVRMASINRCGIVALLICQLFLTFNAHSLQAEESPEDKSVPATSAKGADEEKGMIGIASYYASRYEGRRTTSGVRYNPDKMTAAHQSLPLGSKVRVVNLDNDKEVVVTVNDRCRKRKKPFIDLSRAAAKELGFFGKGITKVRIIPLEEEEEQEEEG
jgi:rare lipoprotein A